MAVAALRMQILMPSGRLAATASVPQAPDTSEMDSPESHQSLLTTETSPNSTGMSLFGRLGPVVELYQLLLNVEVKSGCLSAGILGVLLVQDLGHGPY